MELFSTIKRFYIKHRRTIKEWVHSFIIAFIIALFIKTFILQAFKIPTGSMRPTLQEGDRIFVSKFIYGPVLPFINYRLPGLREPKRGEVIVFRYPLNPKKHYIKRLIAFGGERVRISNGSVYINGKLIDCDLINCRFYYNRGQFAKSNNSYLVPEDSYFVLGDNSLNSKDSRIWGAVEKKYLVGKALCVFWPIWRIKVIR